MPIKGLSDRGLAFPEIGQIRKGAPKGENKPGADLNYFRVEFDEKEAQASADFIAAYGKEPAEISILLPFNEIDRMWESWLEAYTAGRLVARSDGEKYIYKVDTKTGAVQVKNGLPFTPYKDGEVVGTWKNAKTGKEESIVCKPTGRLKVIVPELKRLAYMTVLTTSIHDIINISAQLEALKTINGGNISGVPLVLRRRPKKISTPRKSTDGNAARYTKYLLSIEADPNWVKAKLMEMKHLALPGNGLALLPEPQHEAEPVQEEAAEWSYSDDEQDDDGAWMEPEPEPETKAPEPPKKMTRPLMPHDLIEALEAKAETHANRTASDKQRSLLAMLLAQIFQDDAKRHTFQLFVTGESSIKTIPDPMVIALLDWLKPTQDSGGNYLADAMAEKEAQAAYTEALKAEGQAELFN